MKNLTLEDAVSEVVNDFVAKGQPFSAHQVTTEVRNRVNAQQVEISGVPFGYVDAQNTHSQMITHSDVRDLVGEVARVLNLQVNYSSGHREYSAVAPLMGAGTPIALQTSHSIGIPLNTPATAYSPPPTVVSGTSVPARFTVPTKDTVKQKITRYVRSKLNKGDVVTLHMVQKTIKAGIKLPEIERVIKAEGWNLIPDSSNKARSLYRIS